MGRRKERRLAANSAGGRRVKLDLFAEPSGDHAGSSGQEEGGAGDSKVVDKKPGSPSSSGQLPQNPLLLLGQYSDDELDDGSSESLAKDVYVDNGHQEKDTAGKDTEDIRSSAGNEPCTGNREKLLMDRSFVSQDPLQKVENRVMSDYEELLRETSKLEENTHPTASDKKPIEDLSSGWKMVLDEASNRYYYWNITTGETSWEVPNVWALRSVASEEKVGADIVEGTSLELEKDDVIAKKQLSDDSKPNNETSDVAEEGTGLGGPNGQSKGDSLPVDLSMVNEVDLERSEEYKNGNDLPLQLVRYCENLLEKLKPLKSLSTYLEDQGIKLKNQIEVRLADITALAHHGSSLLPFWLHSEAQLKYVELAIDNAIKGHGSSPTTVTDDSLKPHNGSGADNETDLTEKIASFVAVESHSPECNVGSSLGVQSDGDTENDFTVTETEILSAQEVDMDVDMEVEEASTSISSDEYQHVSSEQNIEPFHPPPEDEQFPPLPPDDEPFPPPPPDDEPFPPPPPDDEPFPPPPPDDEPTYPPVPLSESAQPFTYSEHYTLSYPGSGFEYYSQIPTQVPGTTMYAHLPQYYENAYDVAPVVVNPVGPNYYGLPSGALNPAPSVGSAVESGNQEPASSGILGYSLGTVKTVTEVPGTQPSSSSISVAAMGTVAETASKVQPKGGRSKKRTATMVSTLRPNKKVSSLVDKWKAVKEELHEEEEEDEPENAYEILERKRKREIEEWRAQQIASGEAKDNANFQPLGGDWRERVKRRMAQKKKETRQSSTDVATDGKQQPDLVGLSRSLPSGWQAYWDEASKQVYYGNTATSETTWSKPTK